MAQHAAWLVNTNATIQTANGLVAEVWELKPGEDQAILSAWAKHFRDHYCEDELLDRLRDGTGLSRAEYLERFKFPDAANAPGPSIRSGDFAEILVADYVEFKLGYWCPRELRYDMKFSRNESTKGCDVLGFKLVDVANPSPDDELFIFESKAKLTGQADNRLQVAVNDSAKDPAREGMSLNALKQRCLERHDDESAMKIQRFQLWNANPFKRLNGAAAVVSDDCYDANLIAQTTTDHHPNNANLQLLVVKGPALMQLVHALYQRACDEA